MDMRQKEDGWCGPAVLAYVFKALGETVSQEKLVSELGTTEKNGTEPEDMVNVAVKHGYSVRMFVNEDPLATLQFLEDAAKEGKLGIVDYMWGDNVKTDGHYGVWLKKTGDSIVLWNPSTDTLETKDLGNFIGKWKDVDDHNKLFNYLAITVGNRA